MKPPTAKICAAGWGAGGPLRLIDSAYLQATDRGRSGLPCAFQPSIQTVLRALELPKFGNSELVPGRVYRF